MPGPQVLAEPHQGQCAAVGQLAVDVGELAVSADGDPGELAPALPRLGGQLLAERGLRPISTSASGEGKGREAARCRVQ